MGHSAHTCWAPGLPAHTRGHPSSGDTREEHPGWGKHLCPCSLLCALVAPSFLPWAFTSVASPLPLTSSSSRRLSGPVHPHHLLPPLPVPFVSPGATSLPAHRITVVTPSRTHGWNTGASPVPLRLSPGSEQGSSTRLGCQYRGQQQPPRAPPLSHQQGRSE